MGDDDAMVVVEVAHIEMRGRLNILPRWRKRVSWLSSAEDVDVEALMIFVEPGLISIDDWKKHDSQIMQRIEELSGSADVDALEALRLIADRYQRLIIPARDRPSLGDAALAHLGLPVQRGEKFIVYVCIFPQRIDIMSRELRNLKLREGHPLVDDLP